MSRIQKQDVKTVADLTALGAEKSSLINDSQIFMSSVLGNYTLAEAVLLGLIGGGGGSTGDIPFESAWMSDNSILILVHGQTNAEAIKTYSVLEWDTVADTITMIEPRELVSHFDDTYFYLDWASLSPSPSLKYKIIAGGGNSYALLNLIPFETSWYENTSVTTVPHYLGTKDNIKSYEVHEWDTINNTITTISPQDLVTGFDDNNFYLNWSGLSPSTTLKYKLIVGGKPLPQNIPQYLGGYTKYVGFGTQSYPTLEACLPSCSAGDVILVNSSYSTSNPININVSDIKIVFQPNVIITSTVDNPAFYAFAITANNVIIENLNLLCTGNLNNWIYIHGDGSWCTNVKITYDAAGKTTNIGLYTYSNSDYTYLVGYGIVKNGTVTTKIEDNGNLSSINFR